MLLVLLVHSFAAIANMQWFSEEPSPLNGMVGGNHWDQWFSDGFGVRHPLVTMVFNGCVPLVRRWNGYVSSLKSKDAPLKDRWMQSRTAPAASPAIRQGVPVHEDIFYQIFYHKNIFIKSLSRCSYA